MADVMESMFGKSQAIDPIAMVKDTEPKQETVEATEEVTETVETEPVTEAAVEEQKEERRSKVPFDANHPRFKRVWAELQELKAKEAERERMAQEQTTQPVTPQAQVSSTDIPQEFIDLFGDNREAWEKFRKLSLTPSFDIHAEVQKVLAEQRQQELAQKQAEERAQQQAIQVIEDVFTELADETGVDLNDRDNTVRNQILDIVEKYSLYDTDGLPNIRSAYELHAALYPQNDNIVEEKRKVIAKTNTKTNSSAKESEVFTPSKLREIEKRGGVNFFMN